MLNPPISALLRNSILVLAGSIPLLQGTAHSQQPFEARFVNDHDGTWLVYPTVHGWHYKIESSSTLADADFALVPSTFRYGNGQDERYFIAPPPPPAIPPENPPAPRTYYSTDVDIYVASDPGEQQVEIVSSGGAAPWSARLNRVLPVRDHPIPVYDFGHSPTTQWMISAEVRKRPLAQFVSDPDGPLFTVGSPEHTDYQFVLERWENLVGHLTPNVHDAGLEPPPPAPPPEGYTPPPMTTPVRRFYRVKQTEIDTNGNGLWDWWELENEYEPFVMDQYAPDYTSGSGDSDGDGLSNAAEQFHRTDPHNPDSDGDLSPDGEEVEKETKPLDAESTPTVLVSTGREMHANMWYETDGYHWAIFGSRDAAPLAGSGTLESQFLYQNPLAGSEPEFNVGDPNFDQWDNLLAGNVPFPPSMPSWAREYLPYHATILPGGASHPLVEVSFKIGAGAVHSEWNWEETNSLDQRRVWLRGPEAPAGGSSRTVLLLKETVRGNYLASPPAITENDVEVSTVTFTIPENLRVSQHEDLIPAFKDEPSVPPTARRFQIVRWALIPFEEAPAILESNRDYDEGNTKPPGTGFHLSPVPDSETIPLIVNSEASEVGGKYEEDDIALDDLHEGWFGLGRGVLPPDLYVGSTVTIRKLTPPLEEDEEPESGFVRFHATWLDAENVMRTAHIPTQEKDEFDGEQPPHNLVGVMYGPNATIPANAQIWMEGVSPGKVTLEWRAEGGDFEVSFQQTFEVTSHRSKADWRQVCRERLYHMHYEDEDVDITTLTPSAGFLPNRLHARSVYSFYGDVYFDDTVAHIWTGLAKHAGGAVYGGLSDSLDGGPGTMERKFQQGLLTGIQDIYNDLGWQFQAYSCGGLSAIEHHSPNLEIRPSVVLGWRDIHKGARETTNPVFLPYSPLLDAGSLALAEYEQKVILINAFRIINDVTFFGGVSADLMMTERARNPVPGGPSFLEVVAPGGQMSRADDRWTWISAEPDGMWWEWKAYGEPNRRLGTAKDVSELALGHIGNNPLQPTVR